MTQNGSIVLASVPLSGRKAILPEILRLWEASVRASHRFLADGYIAALRPLVASAAAGVPVLATAQDACLAAFMGVAGARLEMLFVRPDRFRQGIGARLVRHAAERLGVREVDCNEQNPGALAFYLALGFRIEGRSPRDGCGRPFPLLHLRLGEAPRHAMASFREK